MREILIITAKFCTEEIFSECRRREQNASLVKRNFGQIQAVWGRDFLWE
jgi:hypothetical protein